MGPTIAFFRPADERAETAKSIIRNLGGEPLSDPMLAIEPTGNQPREDATYTILTSKTGVELVTESDWEPGGTIVAIGEPTASELERAGYPVGRIPEEYSSTGLVAELADEAAGSTIEVARSDHGSPLLTEGLNGIGAYVHETILYGLTIPDSAGISVERAAAGELDGVCFSSSLTVQHFMEIAATKDIRAAVLDGLETAVIGAIGEPTAQTAREAGLTVDVQPPVATFEALADSVINTITKSTE